MKNKTQCSSGPSGLHLLVTAFIIGSFATWAPAQFVDAIQVTGDSANRIDILFFGDGYRSNQQNKFNNDAADMVEYMFEPAAAGFAGERYADPLPRYKNFFNVIRILKPSVQSGVTTPLQWRNTSLGANFGTPANTGITEMRNLGVDSPKANALLNGLLTSGAIDPDQVDLKMVVVNTPIRGGSGGYAGWSVYNSDDIDSLEISLHEIGHTFGGLTDEGTSDIYPAFYNGTEAELTMHNGTLPLPNGTSIFGGKWSHWSGYVDPDNRIGAIHWFDGNHYHQSGIYRPSTNSKMKWSYGAGAYERVPFDAVGREAIVRQIYRVVDPLDSHTPAGALTNPGTLSVTPIDANVIRTAWYVNGQFKGSGTSLDTSGYAPGTYSVAAYSYDTWVNNMGVDDSWRDPDTNALRQNVFWNVTITGAVDLRQVYLDSHAAYVTAYYSYLDGLISYQALLEAHCQMNYDRVNWLFSLGAATQAQLDQASGCL